MKLKIYTNLHKKLKKGILQDMSKEPLIIENVESYEVIEDMLKRECLRHWWTKDNENQDEYCKRCKIIKITSLNKGNEE